MKRILTLLVIPVLAAACGRSGDTAVVAAASTAQSGSDTAAKIGSRALSNAELDTRLKAELETLRVRAAASEEQMKQQLEDMRGQIKEQEYNLRRKALTEMLFDIEAQSRGITREALVNMEVGAKAQVSTADTDALWEEVKARVKGSTKEQVLGQLQQMAAQRKTESRLAAYQRELFKKHNVTFVGLQPERKTVVIPADAPILGPKDAPITLVEFTDYQCPFCQQAQNTVDRIMATYAGKVRLVYQEFPLDFHGQAKPAGKAARCAGEQGKFWEMHTGLLRSPGALDSADLSGRAKALGLDTARFDSCVASNKYDAVIDKAIQNGRSVGVTGTPAFFLNGRFFSGALPYDSFERVIEDELQMSGAGSGSN
jgi:protein-disulfide isomerase